MKNFKQNLYWITLLIIATLVLIPFFAYFYLTLDPSISTKEKILNSKDQGIILLDRNNQPFFSFDGGRDKNYVPLLLIPKITQQAIIATEDKGFYTHPGFSLKGIFRSLVADIKKKRLL
jgi:membrane peptidoglycan carboxypeptidase